MDDVAQVVELWTGIPAVKIQETEYGRLQGLEDALKAHIIGQDEAVHAVAGAIKRARPICPAVTAGQLHLRGAPPAWARPNW